MVSERLKRTLWVVFFSILTFAYLDQTPKFIEQRENIFVFLWFFCIALIALMYYVFRKDKSESLAIFITGSILLFAGAEDLLFFTIFHIQGKAVDFCVNHSLDVLPFMSFADLKILGNSCVTYGGLFVNVAIGSIVAYFVSKKLIEEY